MSPKDNLAFLANLAKAAPRLLFAKTFIRAETTLDYPLAFGHPLNLFRPPYCAADPLELHRDDFFDAFMGLWKVAARSESGAFATSVDGASEHESEPASVRPNVQSAGVWGDCDVFDEARRWEASAVNGIARDDGDAGDEPAGRAAAPLPNGNVRLSTAPEAGAPPRWSTGA